MPTYKLTYFELKGRAEITRMLFALGDLKYEDIRVKMEEWPALKPKLPLRQLPLLEIDGTILGQSHAMERLLAKRLGVYGNGDLEQAKSDMITDTIEDKFMKPIDKLYEMKTDQEKAQQRAKIMEEMQATLEMFETQVNKDGFFISNKIMWPDVAIFTAIDGMSEFGLDVCKLLPKFPKLKALTERVAAHPNIAKWVAQRPALGEVVP